ncbi:MAG: GTP-binding protein [Clostridia bacterium]|nr:GTP-binding protein [Clostridia bacterium]
MTKINIISGFLGAGKTTLIKKLLSGAFKNEKVVLLENEYGEVGVDSGFMRDSGIQITELNSGCICCTLVGDFSRALDELIETYHPDRIVIEPSGVGKLSDIRKVVVDLMKDHEITLEGSATVADVGKCRMYAKNFGEFFIDQIENAETIILSRTQKSTEEKIEKCVELLREYNEHARVITTPWDELTSEQMLEVIESAESLLNTEEVVHEHHEHHHHHDHDEHECCCSDDHEHEHHHHHDHDEHECCCGHDHDHEHHHHHDHHHEHGEGCTCGCHDHHGHHHADEVFQNIGVETPRKFEEAAIRSALEALENEDKYGIILRAKGILPLNDGKWLHFDYVPGESDVRYGSADYTGRLCVIGTGIHEGALKELFGL